MYYNQLLTTTALALLLSTLVSPVYADENTDNPVVMGSHKDSLDSVQKGSIQIQMSNQETGEAMSGISFRISKVASIENGKYLLSDEYKDSGIDFSSIKDSKDVEQAIEKLEKVQNVRYFEDKTNDIGVCEFYGLSLGVYLIMPVNESDDIVISSSLVSVPEYDSVSGYVYQVRVLPKYTLSKDEEHSDTDKTQTEDKEQPKKDKESPNTSVESSQEALWMSMGLAALGVLLANKKKNKE